MEKKTNFAEKYEIKIYYSSWDDNFSKGFYSSVDPGPDLSQGWQTDWPVPSYGKTWKLQRYCLPKLVVNAITTLKTCWFQRPEIFPCQPMTIYL
jgi:hypothetical protein